MKKFLLIGFLAIGLSVALPVSAHRSGCHRWHTCPSDTGSYSMEYWSTGEPKQFCGSKMYMGSDGHCHYYDTVLPSITTVPESPSIFVPTPVENIPIIDDTPPPSPKIFVYNYEKKVTIKWGKSDKVKKYEVALYYNYVTDPEKNVPGAWWHKNYKSTHINLPISRIRPKGNIRYFYIRSIGYNGKKSPIDAYEIQF